MTSKWKIVEVGPKQATSSTSNFAKVLKFQVSKLLPPPLPHAMQMLPPGGEGMRKHQGNREQKHVM